MAKKRTMHEKGPLVREENLLHEGFLRNRPPDGPLRHGRSWSKPGV